jgi:hypothetical protein
VSSDIVKRLRDAHQTVPLPSIASIYSNAADLLDAIDALHQPERTWVETWFDPPQTKIKCSCGTINCPTARLLRPEGGPS